MPTAKELCILEERGIQPPQPTPFHADYMRWLNLHSWYKHIPLIGKSFVICKGTGEQPRNGVHPSVTDTSGVHLYFFNEDFFESNKEQLEREGVDVHKYAAFQTGPFMTQNIKNPHGFHIIYEKATPAGFEKWLETTHPSLKSLYDTWIEDKFPYRHEFICELYKAENAIYYRNFCTALETLT